MPHTGAINNVTFDRDEVNLSTTTVTVPGDEPTIQDAVRKVPRQLYADYIIDIDGGQGDYGEDVVVPPVMTMDNADATEGVQATLELKEQNGNTWTTRSVFAQNPMGQRAVTLRDVEVTDDNPYDDENAGIAFYGGKMGLVVDASFQSNVTNGILAYNSDIKVTGASFGSSILSRGFKVKQGGRVRVEDTGSLTTTGTLTDVVFSVENGYAQSSKQITATGNNGDFGQQASKGGFLLLGEDNSLHGVDNLTLKQLATETPGSVSDILDLNPQGRVVGTPEFTIGDDQKQAIITDHFAKMVTILLVVNKTDNRAGLFTAAGGTVTELEDDAGVWEPSDTDGNNCVFQDANDDLVVKNRLADGNKTYSAFALNINGDA